MKHTREQLDGMSDHTLNHALYVALFNAGKPDIPETCPDYCGDWNAIMPLAVEYKIGLQHFNRCQWQAHSQHDETYHHNNPQRAIACCLIMVLESKV